MRKASNGKPVRGFTGGVAELCPFYCSLICVGLIYTEAMTKTKGALPLTVPEIEKAKALFALGRSYRSIAAELHRSAHAIKRALTRSPAWSGL